MNLKDSPFLQEAMTLLEQKRQNHDRENTLANRLAGHEPLFSRLPRNRRHRAHEGRVFVFWERQADQPVIRALFRVDSFSLTPTQGPRVHMTVSTPSRVYEIDVGCRPQVAVAGLPIYLWMQAQTELRFIPVNSKDPESRRILHVPFMSRTSGHPDHDVADGDSYFDPVADFSKRWPKHAF